MDKEIGTRAQNVRSCLESIGDAIIRADNRFKTLPQFLQRPLRDVTRGSREKRIKQLESELNIKAAEFALCIAIEDVYAAGENYRKTFMEPKESSEELVSIPRIKGDNFNPN